MSELVRKKQISASELLEKAIELTERLDPMLNAIPIKHFDLAREYLKTNDNKGIFIGVPFLLKDLNNYLEGTVTTGDQESLKMLKPIIQVN